jgi:hypothetical protein
MTTRIAIDRLHWLLRDIDAAITGSGHLPDVLARLKRAREEVVAAMEEAGDRRAVSSPAPALQPHMHQQ